MNLPEHYSLAEDNADHFVIHDGRDGKKFPVAKKGLHPATQIKVMNMQKLADGGDVEDAPDVGGVGQLVNPSIAPSQPSGASGSWDAPTPDAAPQQAPDQAPQLQAPNPLPNDVVGQYNANNKQQLDALQAKGGAESAAGRENAKNISDSNAQLKNIYAQSQQDLWNQNVENQNLAESIANTKIDPNHFFHSKSTGQKIGTAIALVMGGIGAGLSGGPNLAYEAMQKSIANDIDAQKAELGKKQSLLSENIRKYGDMKAATQATAMQMNSILQGQIAATSAKYGAQANQAGTQALIGQLKNQQLMGGQQLQQMVTDQKIKEHLAQGDVQGQDPLDYVKHVVPEAHQKDVINELGKAQSANAHQDEMMQLFDQADKENTLMKTGAGLLRTPPSVKTLTALGDPLIHDNDGRVNEFEKKDFENLLPKPGDMPSTVQAKRKGMEQFINTKKSAPTAKSFGIDINRFGSTQTRDSAPTKTVGGITYKRGPSGEAIRVN